MTYRRSQHTGATEHSSHNSVSCKSSTNLDAACVLITPYVFLFLHTKHIHVTANPFGFLSINVIACILCSYEVLFGEEYIPMCNQPHHFSWI